MAENRVDRRLAAIFAGDIAGYSWLMGADEEGTLRQLKAHRKELVDPKITEHRGRIVKTTGDGMLVEFASVVDAVRCAVDIQRDMIERNTNVPPEKRIQFRIGINVGDIIIDGDDIFGDGVNVAARLEGLADPGGILVSGVVHDQVCDKLSFGFANLGEQVVKNISRPIGVYRVHWPEQASSGATDAAKSGRSRANRPSIAVLPFVNMSGDPEQEYFTDGISEDIITALSRLRWFFVIARNSSFAYKGKAVDVKRVSHELGVRYLLEGSVRKSGNRVRISAQLIDAATGNHLWADRYDGDLTDIFALQDTITKKVVAVMEPKLLEAEGIRSQERSPEDIGAWDMVIRANSLFWRFTKSDSEHAIAMLNQAVERFPDYAPAHSMLAFILLVSRHLALGTLDADPQMKRAASLAERAAELDDSDPWAHVALGYVAMMMRRADEAASEFQRALEGECPTQISVGRGEVRIEVHPQNAIFTSAQAIAHYMAGRYPEAVDASRKVLQLRAGMLPGMRVYVASLAQAGRMNEARAILERIKEVHPALSVAWIEQNVPYMPGPMAKFLEGMRKAGLQ
jgi:adenylate cyclase